LLVFLISRILLQERLAADHKTHHYHHQQQQQQEEEGLPQQPPRIVRAKNLIAAIF
jgi:hypothetical protein